MVPLSPSLDTVGVIARSVSCCSILYGLLAERPPRVLTELAHLPRLAVVRRYLLDGADPFVLESFNRALDRLSDTGADVLDLDIPELDHMPAMNASGGSRRPKASRGTTS
jgi:aspartyl-tRNA(Asn)/glutamyl-tRNA(Gln) amidotransferase subunit A